MSNVKNKSEENFKATILLIDNNMYAASIHCAYYSCFQLSKYLLKNKCAIEYETQESNSKGIDSHSYIIRETSSKIDSISHLAYLDFNCHISKLKKLRKKADYSTEAISKTEAENAYKCATEITTILNTKLTA